MAKSKNWEAMMAGAKKRGVLAGVAMGDNWAWVDGEPILLSGLGLG